MSWRLRCTANLLFYYQHEIFYIAVKYIVNIFLRGNLGTSRKDFLAIPSNPNHSWWQLFGKLRLLNNEHKTVHNRWLYKGLFSLKLHFQFNIINIFVCLIEHILLTETSVLEVDEWKDKPYRSNSHSVWLYALLPVRWNLPSHFCSTLVEFCR